LGQVRLQRPDCVAAYRNYSHMPSAPVRDVASGVEVLARRCARCRQPVAAGKGFMLAGSHRCLGCALRFRPLLRRSAQTSLVVGTILVAINQGTLLVQGQVPAELAWKIPLTYCVPFCVATWSALSNNRG